MNPTEPIVGVFLKAPVPGTVKTRLGRTIGPVNAATVYALGLGILLTRLQREGLMFVAFVDPPEERDWIRRLFGLPSSISLVRQRGSDLGERMENALRWMISTHPGKSPVLIGSDSPDLPLSRITTAARALESVDLVLGPATDGGYYLIATRRPHPRLFEGIPWSSSRVLEKTLRRARELGYRHRLLEEWNDVDTWEDLTERL